MNTEQMNVLTWATQRLAELKSAGHEKSAIGQDITRLVREHIDTTFPDLAEKQRAEARAAQEQAIELRKQQAEQKGRLMAVAGPKAWGILHLRTLLPVLDAAAEVEWLKNFGKSLPCGECAFFFASYLSLHPAEFDREGFSYFHWGVDLHNAVNEKASGDLGNKQEGKQYSYAEARAIWEAIAAQKGT
jgi:hypothetical protein